MPVDSNHTFSHFYIFRCNVESRVSNWTSTRRVMSSDAVSVHGSVVRSDWHRWLGHSSRPRAGAERERERKRMTTLWWVSVFSIRFGSRQKTRATSHGSLTHASVRRYIFFASLKLDHYLEKIGSLVTIPIVLQRNRQRIAWLHAHIFHCKSVARPIDLIDRQQVGFRHLF